MAVSVSIILASATAEAQQATQGMHWIPKGK
jgi:hypothetical protein